MSGTNTLLLAYQSPPKPDVIALAAIVGNTGIVDIPGSNGIGAFAVATTNVGGAGSITVRADLDSELRRRVGAKLPAQALVCQTDAQGACLAPPAASGTLTMATNATATFSVFVYGSGTVPFDPGIYRVIVSFTNTTTGDFAGATSVALRTI